MWFLYSKIVKQLANSYLLVDGILHDLHIEFGYRNYFNRLKKGKALCQMDVSMQMKLYFHYYLQRGRSSIDLLTQ